MHSIHDFDAVERLRRRHKLDTESVRRLRTAFYKRQRGAELALAVLPPAARDDFARQLEFHPLRLVDRRDSTRDGASKLVFRTASGRLVESVVLRLSTGRTTLCLSTQVGCRARCDFCATGRMRVVENLAAAEVLDQLAQAAELVAAEGRRVRNVVFMGMGEPFHNAAQLDAALAVLVDRQAFDLHPRRLMISTVGIPDAMLRCARRWPEVRMAVSLHSARQDVRERLMPIARCHGLAELRAAVAEVARIQAHEVMIEYLLLDGMNDAPQDSAALVEYLRGIPVHVNLIPYNAIADAPHLRASPPGRARAFAAALKAAGLSVTTRYSLGADIAAACGQLVRNEPQGAMP